MTRQWWLRCTDLREWIAAKGEPFEDAAFTTLASALEGSGPVSRKPDVADWLKSVGDAGLVVTTLAPGSEPARLQRYLWTYVLDAGAGGLYIAELRRSETGAPGEEHRSNDFPEVA